MVPILAALAHHVASKIGAKLGSGKFGQHVKPPVILPHLELERVEPSKVELQRAPAQELLHRIQASMAEGDRALKKLLDARAQNAVRPEELHALEAQVKSLNTELERLSQTVEQSLQAIKPTPV